MPGPLTQDNVAIHAGATELTGRLHLPDDAVGLSVFVHGHAGGHDADALQCLAAALHQCGFGTLLFDLLSADEPHLDPRSGQPRFDFESAARRLIGVVDWVRSEPPTQHLRLGLVATGAGAAAALAAAAERPSAVAALVSRAGRPDLAGAVVQHVATPTLLIVGGNDTPVLRLNRTALRSLRGERALRVIPGGTHLLAEPQAARRVAELTAAWFRRHLHA